MKRQLTLTLAIVACPLLAACASTKSVEPPRLQPVDAALAQPCAEPVRTPERKLSNVETERLWGRDRRALVECKGRHAAVVDHYARRDAALFKR